MRCACRLKVKAIPVQTWRSPEGTKRLRLPDFKTIGIYEGGRLSAIRTGRLYTPGNIPGTHFSLRLSRFQGHRAAGRIMPIKNPSGIEPATVCVVAQCLNQLRHREAPSVRYNSKILANSPCLMLLSYKGF